jgi:hypothetical protein
MSLKSFKQKSVRRLDNFSNLVCSKALWQESDCSMILSARFWMDSIWPDNVDVRRVDHTGHAYSHIGQMKDL